MGELQPLRSPITLSPPPPESNDDPPPPQSVVKEKEDSAPPTSPPPPRFDPSRMIGIIRRKALIKDLAAVYHAECLSYCQELLKLQRKYEEPCTDIKVPVDSRKQTMKPPKRLKKTR